MRRLLSTMVSGIPKRFAPLKQSSDATSSTATKLRGVVFDMDGTLCLPQNYMFGEMRDVLGIAKGTDILEHIESLPADQQPGAHESIKAIESKAMESQAPQPGLNALMDYLDSRSVPKAICTRNFDVPVQNLLEKFLQGSHFHPVVTRAFQPPKPDPAGILHIAQKWELQNEAGSADASGLIMVGDSIDDITAGRRAGAATVLLVNSANEYLAEHAYTDLTIKSLDELIEVLENGFEGRQISDE